MVKSYIIITSGIGLAVLAIASIFALTTKNIPSQFLSEISHQSAGVSLVQDAKPKNSSSQNKVIKQPACQFETSLAPRHELVVLKEIAWMGDKESPNNEWVALYKIENGNLDISGYQVINQNQKIQAIVPDGVILTHEKPEYILARDTSYSGALRNTNEGLRLFEPDCSLLDQVLANPTWPAGDNTSKVTMKRNLADLSWYTDSPIALNNQPEEEKEEEEPPLKEEQPSVEKQEEKEPEPEVIQPSGDIVINEVMAGKDGESSYEFIELYNPNSFDVDLTGWSIKKKTSTGTESSLVASSRFENKKILAGKYLLLANTLYLGESAADIVWPASYTLAYKNNSVTLYNKNKESVSSASWTEIEEGKSWSRASFDSDDFQIKEPTPKN